MDGIIDRRIRAVREAAQSEGGVALARRPSSGFRMGLSARGRTPTESSFAGTPLELVVQVPWSRRPLDSA